MDKCLKIWFKMNSVMTWYQSIRVLPLPSRDAMQEEPFVELSIAKTSSSATSVFCRPSVFEGFISILAGCSSYRSLCPTPSLPTSHLLAFFHPLLAFWTYSRVFLGHYNILSSSQCFASEGHTPCVCSGLVPYLVGFSSPPEFPPLGHRRNSIAARTVY